MLHYQETVKILLILNQFYSNTECHKNIFRFILFFSVIDQSPRFFKYMQTQNQVKKVDATSNDDLSIIIFLNFHPF